jgi:hypothetical protein
MTMLVILERVRSICFVLTFVEFDGLVVIYISVL